MAHFFLQDLSESDALDVEIAELKSELDQWHSNTYQIVSSSFFENYDDAFCSRDWVRKHCVPVGSIQFVQTFLREFHGIPNMNPIEIPKCLRLTHILLRDYQILPYEKLPNEGVRFVKDVSVLKGGSCAGFISDGYRNESWKKDHLYQVSSFLDIISEYRVVVIENKIYGIQFYDGDPTVMPTPREIKKIKEMVVRYSVAKDCPGAYTLDVAVVRSEDEEGRDLALIEVHPAICVGTYGCRGPFLQKMYRLGLEWYVKYNTPIESTE